MEKKKNTFVLCDPGKVNTHGFSVSLAGMDTTRFETNPVMLMGHDPERIIGRWENLREEGGRLLADAVFDTADPDGAKAAGRVERGFLKGCSMGIIVFDVAEDPTDGHIVATRTELVEGSLCAVPSDAGAVALYDEDRKMLSNDDIKLKLNIKPNNTIMDKQEKTVEQLQLELAQKDKTIADLRSEIASHEATRQNLELKLAERDKEAVEQLLTAAVTEGRISADEKESFAKLAATDFDTVKEIVGKRQAKPTASLHEMAKGKAAPGGDRQDWTYLEWMKKDPEGLRKMKTEDPERFKTLQQTLKR